ncbi:hypothetical protein [Halobaculum limi]|uniref:hypothetical protein n=1 Tax=Halobaculum limi TaxID=3031916 RepID=UPI002405D6FC|nr:hypothetical protein [Halobaculum sp. YSMS11]
MSRLLARSRVLATLRVFVVAAGLAGHVAVTAFVLDLPPPPETGDGLPAGFAFAFALIGTVAAGVVTVVGYGLPAGDGPLARGPFVDRPSVFRLCAGGATAAAVGIGLAVGLSFLLSGMVTVAVWVLGVGLIVGGVVALAVAGVAVAVRAVAGEGAALLRARG